jgi:hypothetical protein
MAKCDYCGTRILFGGVRDGNLRFCNQKCRQNGVLLSLTSQVPTDVLQKHVDEVHQGRCPNCHGPGPIDAHTSYRVWSIILMTTWSSRPKISCRSCGIKRQLGDMAICLLFGWWGFPWGLILTPIQISRNIYCIFRPPDPSKPSSLLHRLVCLNIAAHLAQNAKQQPPKA